ncbi:uncharacterized protein NPIL_402671 [Nephila pilipes]|uniref:Uncharacterized protein n=1 Tax=Nephila pilipes TaxID=299642 RepID=A0A8X6QFT1_NEPPI|nr:uncharacterized protein NPIL_402671 [Nephila pilipes]
MTSRKSCADFHIFLQYSNGDSISRDVNGIFCDIDGVSKEVLEVTMEIMPSKFRSPPPKPPRRRHSDQLTISPSGTYPSSRKKYHDETKFCLKEAQSKSGNSTGCGSLPANWTPDFSPHNEMDSSVLLKSASQGSSFHSKTIVNIKIPISSVLDKDSNGVSDAMMDIDFKTDENFDWTRKKLPFLEQVVKSNILSKLNSRDFLEYFRNDSEIECSPFEMPSNSFELKSFPREYHRRHHSDPVISHLDRSNPKNGSQKYVPKTHSFLESLSFDNQNRLYNSLGTSNELKETQNLHEEIKTLKDINNKLWQHLCSTQVCLEKMKKNSEENIGSLSISDLLTSLYCSQRAKDSAMEDRMKIILEERDAAIRELEDMVQIIARSFKDDTVAGEEMCSEKEIEDLLKEIEITYNPAKLLQQQRLLLTYLYRSKELKQDRIMHELKLAVSEKNHFREKVEYLEEELKSMRVCNELWNSDNKHWENNLLNILCQVIQQRDIALSKVNNAQNLEHTNFRSANENSRIAETMVEGYESFQKHEGDSISLVKRNFQSSHHDMRKCDQFSIEPSSDEIRLLKGEILVLNKALEMEIEKRENAEEKCSRLERLVNVLQRKVNGQNVGISV